MKIDNYGNIIGEPFHEYRYCIEWDYWDGWQHFKSYQKPIDVQKALTDLRNGIWKRLLPNVKFRPNIRTYRKIKDGSNVYHYYKDVEDNLPLLP